LLLTNHRHSYLTSTMQTYKGRINHTKHWIH